MTGQNIACGNSREPPVFARFGGINLEAKFARAAGHDPKRLPSRREARLLAPGFWFLAPLLELLELLELLGDTVN